VKTYLEYNKTKHKVPTFESWNLYLFYAYANLNMLHYAVNQRKEKYDRTCFIIRSKAYKAYKEGNWHIHDLLENNVAKMKSDNKHCAYCGKEVSSPKDLTVDHIFARKKGGGNDADNIMLVCQECNSSKRDSDLLKWFFTQKDCWPSIDVLQHYIKQIYAYSKENSLLDKSMDEIAEMDLPFDWKYIPLSYPNPIDMYPYLFQTSNV